VRSAGVSPPSRFSLDERYLDFCRKIGGVFAVHPQLEPLRHLVFKDLLVRRRADGWWQRAKHWMRPLHRRASTPTPQRADVLIWLEGQREVIVDALLPVYRELVRRGASIALYHFLVDQGFTNVRRYDGGIADWEVANLPLEGEWIGN
jgi:hypothetical protein